MLGVVTFVPLLVIVYLVVRTLQFMIGIADSGGSAAPEELGDLFRELLVINVATSLVLILLMGFYIWHVVAGGVRKDPTHQVLWVVVIVLVPPVAMPVYWFLYVWPEPGRDAANGRDERSGEGRR